MTTPSRHRTSRPVPSVSPTPGGSNDAGRASRPKGGYSPGMFVGVNSVEDFAKVLGVPADAIKLIVPKNDSCRSKECPFNAIKGNNGYCPAHQRAWYPLRGKRGSDLVGPEFMRWNLETNVRGCDCSQSSCIATGYFPNQAAICVPVSGWKTAANTPNLLSPELKKKVKEKKVAKLFLYPWHFFPNHRERGEDGVWRLSYNKKEDTKYYDLEGNAYDFPPPRNTPGNFLRDEYFSSYIHPRDRWTEENSKLPVWMLNMLALDDDNYQAPGVVEELSYTDLLRKLEQHRARSHFLQQQKLDLVEQHNKQLSGQKQKHEEMMGKANAKINEHEKKIEELEKQNRELQEELRILRSQLKELKKKKGRPLRYHDLFEGGVLAKHVEQFTLFNKIEQNEAFLKLINFADGSEGSFSAGDGLCENLRPYSSVKRDEREGEVEPPSYQPERYCEYLKKRRAAKEHDDMTWKDDYLAYCIYVRAGTTQAFAATLVGISDGRMSDIFHEWSQILEAALVEMFPTPTRSQMLRAYPSRFIEANGHGRSFMLLDASEIFVQKSSNVNVASSTHSDYKGHTTVKFLGACDPIGCVPAKFISEGNPGRASDGLITKQSNIIREVPFGHSVKVDKGFLIENDAIAEGVHVDRPQKRLKKQVQQSTVDTSQTQKVGNTRIIVENVNGELKLGIRYLNVLIPCTQFGIISKVVRIGYLLQNFKKAIIQNRNPDETPSQRARPCRAQIRWYGETDAGLVDIRGNVRLWGMKCEIDLHNKLSQMEEHKNKSPTEISEMVLAENLHLKKRKELYEKVRRVSYEGDA